MCTLSVGGDRRGGRDAGIEIVHAFDRPAGNDQPLDVGIIPLQAARHAGVIEVLPFLREHIGRAAGELQHVIELARAEIRIDLVGDGAQQLERNERDGKFDAVGKLDGDDVAAPDADRTIELRGIARSCPLARR